CVGFEQGFLRAGCGRQRGRNYCDQTHRPLPTHTSWCCSVTSLKVAPPAPSSSPSASCKEGEQEDKPEEEAAAAEDKEEEEEVEARRGSSWRWGGEEEEDEELVYTPQLGASRRQLGRRYCEMMTSPRRVFFFLRFGFLLLALCHLHCPARAAAAVPAVTAPSDVAALAALKAAVLPSSVPTRSCLATWDFSAADPCASPRRAYFVCGVVCDYPAGGGLARVISVVLEGAGYEGKLPAAIANLSSLAHLDLSGNGFRGPVPAALGSLGALRTLSLASNSFSGEIPPSLAGLGALELLDLSRNALKGAVPAALAAGLVSLRNLDLSYNRLSGGMPPALPPNLVSLALRGNALSGPLASATFAGLLHLEVVELAANRITGRLEGWFLRMPALQQANLANNSLVGISVGTPASPGADAGSSLVALDAGYNRIEGELPAELAGFPALTSLSLRNNRLKGAIPAQYSAGKKAGNPFRRLFLDGNFLNGKVPGEFLVEPAATTGSFGDNCLEGCPATEQLCQPLQKSAKVCKEVYGDVARGRGQRRGPRHPAAPSPSRR
ncbi:hypothetical protein Taro_000845, partial [Colocasia esculenta]|nr:hypothetical protein [Colocasia esculenta]